MFFLHKDFLHPKYWVLALLLSVFWLVTRLPYSQQIMLGRKIGRFLFRHYRRARKIIEKNIDLCYPDLNKNEKTRLASRSGEELGISIMETFLVWFRNIDRFLAGRVSIEGQGHFDDAMHQAQGVILLSCHFGSVDLNAALLSSLNRKNKRLVATFRQTDTIINRFLLSVRGKYCDALVPSTQQRTIVKELKKGNIVWYAPDIEVKSKGCEYAQFMGVDAYTTTAIARLAEITGAVVLPVAHYRSSEDPKYRLKIFPALENGALNDRSVATRTVNHAIEKIIEPHPDRYWWVIKRFKNQPSGISPY